MFCLFLGRHQACAARFGGVREREEHGAVEAGGTRTLPRQHPATDEETRRRKTGAYSSSIQCLTYFTIVITMVCVVQDASVRQTSPQPFSFTLLLHVHPTLIFTM